MERGHIYEALSSSCGPRPSRAFRLLLVLQKALLWLELDFVDATFEGFGKG